MDSSKFKDKFGLWFDKFKPFIESEEMDKIYAKLKEDARNGTKILPASEDTFKVFEKVSPDNLKVIFIGSDPYYTVKKGLNVATGISFDCSNTGECQPSLEKFYEGIENELFNGLNLDYLKTPSLDYLLEQGIMLLNADLTVKENKPGSYKGLWKKFQQYFLEDVIGGYFTGVPVILCGRTAQDLEKFVNPLSNYVFKCEHPSFAARENRSWDTNNVFTQVNKVLKHDNNFKIHWLFEPAPF